MQNIDESEIGSPNDAEKFQPIRPVADLMVSPNNPPWNGWVAIGYWVLSVIFIIAVPAVFLFPYLISKHLDLTDRAGLNNFIFTDPTAIILQLAPVILAHVLTIAAGWMIVTRLNKYSFRKTLGWEMDGFRIWHAIALTVAFYVFGYLMTSAFGKVENDFEKLITGSRVAVYLVAILATFTAPLVEEVVYRGVVYSAFQRAFETPLRDILSRWLRIFGLLGKLISWLLQLFDPLVGYIEKILRRFALEFAIAFVTLLFTIVHVPQYSMNGVPDYASVITLLVLSLTLTLIRAKTGNLLPCIVLHTVFNGIQSLLLVLEPLLPSTDTATPDPTGFIHHFLK